ncbi:hypothetical protein PATSB16_25470 [Pandoraea thiooxydans]|nr:hypothetical protein PATSB16_25470 [Pandoraea thiooxydans]
MRRLDISVRDPAGSSRKSYNTLPNFPGLLDENNLFGF